MTDTTVADATPTTTLFRTWWTNKNLQYDLVMSFILIVLNVAAILYITHHKIPFTANNLLFQFCICSYGFSGLGSFMGWSWAICVVEAYDMYIFGRTCHIFGFAVFLHLLYFISPRLTLWFGIPCSLWFLAAFIESLHTVFLPHVFEDLRDCWKFVNEEQVRVATV
ncbi:membrane protein [Raphanus sativus]|uniref:Uncharacterized protein LOC108808355 n=1 Tax=Raphanus sativus TaxID=3726 RepID=A0A6J0JMD3_RAPSA|nr:uncharacterized protein LOC108808355 [Raphanus sativus]KAJ4889866.1 membrane protein [Raphanus sativus]